MTKLEFIDAYRDLFAGNSELKVRFKMGEDMRGAKRLNQVLRRFEDISDFVFRDKEIWVFLIVWNANEENAKKLLKEMSGEQGATSYYHGKIDDGLVDKERYDEEAFEDAEIVYLKYDHYSINLILPIVYSKAGYDLGMEDTTGILAYFLCFEDHPILLNLYDDRGMELLSHDKNTINSVCEKFRDYVIP